MKYYMPTQPKTPECNKLALERKTRVTIESFLGWLRGRGLWLYYDNGDAYFKRDDQIAFEFLDIDEKKLEAERRALLEWQQALNERNRP